LIFVQTSSSTNQAIDRFRREPPHIDEIDEQLVWTFLFNKRHDRPLQIIDQQFLEIILADQQQDGDVVALFDLEESANGHVTVPPTLCLRTVRPALALA
jgi:hypothetical protein